MLIKLSHNFQLLNWLVNNAEVFLQSHQEMGTALAPAREFQDQHLLLAADLQVLLAILRSTFNFYTISQNSYCIIKFR